MNKNQFNDFSQILLKKNREMIVVKNCVNIAVLVENLIFAGEKKRLKKDISCTLNYFMIFGAKQRAKKHF